MPDFESLRRVLRIPSRRSREQAAADVEAEIRFHLAARASDLEARGVPAEEARRRAEREFGDVGAARRSLRRLARGTERRRRGTASLAALRRDASFGWRKLTSSPGFTATAVTTLALGIGATTAIFSVVYAVLLRPLPYPEPDRLVKVWETTPDGAVRNVVSTGNYLDWRDQATSFRTLGAHSWLFGMTLMGSPDPVRVRVARITPSALAALGTRAVVGRVFTEAEGRTGAGAVALLGHGLWRDRFGGDPGVVGRTIDLDGQSHTVVGVMPESFDFPSPEVEVWRALQFGADSYAQRESHQWNVVGRLADGATLESASAEMATIARRLALDHPREMTGWGVNVVALREDLVGETRALLLILMGVVGLVLLLTAVNLANLLLARATTRERELAVRGALGAGRMRLVRQLLVESTLLGALGGALAVVVVVAGLDAMIALAPPDIPLLDDVRVDPVLLAFAAGTTLLATLGFGLVPALRATVARPGLVLRGGRQGAAGHARLRSALLVVEVALAVVLVVGAGLLLRSMARLNAVEPGMETGNVVSALVDVPRPAYPTTARQMVFYRALLERLHAVAGVEAAAGTTEPPITGYASTFSFEIEGRVAANASGREDDERLAAVTPGLFRTLRIPVLRGRAIDETDHADAPPVAVLSESLARKHWPDGDALGARLRFRAEHPWMEVVGVVGDVRMDGLDRPAPPILYIAQAQKHWDWLTWLTLTLRTRRDPAAVARALRAEVRALDPAIIPERITTFDQLYAASAARRRFATVLLGAFAGLALVLGALGIYGLLAYSVAQRRQEIGIRMALGAEPRRVAAQVVVGALRIAVAGIAIGALGALALGRSLRTLLFQVQPADPATFVAACAALLALAAAAAWLPARNATRVDPAGTIREA